MAAALSVVTLHFTSSNLFVSSFSVMSTAKATNRQSQPGWAAAGSSATIESGRTSTTTTSMTTAPSTTTALCMAGVRTRGLEQRREGATPTGTYATDARHTNKACLRIPDQRVGNERKMTAQDSRVGPTLRFA